ncbi:hypothetical protein [Noviherbaspirillum sp.]|jgi:hypothetical protein|uniref:hypothetical protein n=1 Tax=Noviherbaspirillum sp. TaxID=1926288 RepID=UPI0025DE0F93|nr:hypothetical protein [Noviherbaspirillum sp.]
MQVALESTAWNFSSRKIGGDAQRTGKHKRMAACARILFVMAVHGKHGKHGKKPYFLSFAAIHGFSAMGRELLSAKDGKDTRRVPQKEKNPGIFSVLSVFSVDIHSARGAPIKII